MNKHIALLLFCATISFGVEARAQVDNIFPNTGNVGIGTTSPVAKLQVSGGGSIVSGVNVGTDVAGIDYPYEYETVGVSATNFNLRLQSPNWLIFHTGSAPTERLAITSNGDVGIGTMNPAARLDVNGMTRTGSLQITGGADLAEQFELGTAETVEPGMLVSIDPERPGQLRLAKHAYDRMVAGVVSGANDLSPGLTMGQQGTAAAGHSPVALTGRVYTFADAANGPIEPGDLLTTSDIPGHAMKVTDHPRAQGAIIGKAMSSLEKGRGLVLTLVSLQ